MFMMNYKLEEQENPKLTMTFTEIDLLLSSISPLLQLLYSFLNTDVDMSKSCSNISVLAFDFQQNLPLPHIPVGEIFYLRQLWLYVFGIHCFVDNRASMYCWDETVAKKGANEVISCLNNYFSGVGENN